LTSAFGAPPGITQNVSLRSLSDLRRHAVKTFG
jgi:hypothetical protein